MTLEEYKDQIRLELTGYIIDLELSEEILDQIVKNSLREIQRYICSTNLITIPYTSCINLSDPAQTNNEQIYVNSVARVYRADGYISTDDGASTDPMSMSYWQMLSPSGNINRFQNYMYNYMSWNTLLQMRNTTSTDLAFRFDKSTCKLYINIANDKPTKITVEYVPEYQDVSEIVSDYWIDQLMKMCIAYTKIVVGRVRSRYTQSGALWQQDGETILQEGLQELRELREYLSQNSQLVYPID